MCAPTRRLRFLEHILNTKGNRCPRGEFPKLAVEFLLMNKRPIGWPFPVEVHAAVDGTIYARVPGRFGRSARRICTYVIATPVRHAHNARRDQSPVFKDACLETSSVPMMIYDSHDR